jgi:hypothetical protein
MSAQNVPYFPHAISDLTAPWLTAVLGTEYPGTEVTSLTTGTVIKGTATKVRLMLTYNDAGHAHRLPPTLWVKGGYEAHSGDQQLAYATETNFYKQLAPQLDIGCPRAWIAHADAESGQSLLILEDLLARNATFGHPSRPISPDAAAQVLQILAKLHARFWNRDLLTEIPWLKSGGHLLQSDIIENLFAPAVWDRVLQWPRAKFITGVLRDRERVRETMLLMLRTDTQRAQCLVHGDPHLGNLSFDQKGHPAYLDWQTVMPGFWAHDVADFMTTAMTIADRRDAEQDLLRGYLKHLAEHGAAAPSFDEAWLEYRRHALYNFNWALCLPEWQPEEACYPAAERACAAIEDLDSLGAWMGS